MTELEIQALEIAAGLTLPPCYRKLLLDYPQKLRAMAQLFPSRKGPPQRIGPETAELYSDLKLLHQQNVVWRAAKVEIFPPQFFVIGDSGFGDLYAIDTCDPSGAVYMAGPHSGEYPTDGDGTLLPICDSLEEWVEWIASGGS